MLAIGLLALGLRSLYATEYITHPLGRLLWVDETVCWERARAILGGRWLPDRPFFQDPLIHYLLAGVMSLLVGLARSNATNWGRLVCWSTEAGPEPSLLSGLGELLSWIMNTAPERPIDRGKSENRNDQ